LEKTGRERRAGSDHAWAARALALDEVDRRIEQALRAEREAVLPLRADLTTEALDEVRRRNSASLREHQREMALSVAKLEASVRPLEAALNVERNKILDLPSPLGMKSVN
jgi:hypothetical protein